MFYLFAAVQARQFAQPVQVVAAGQCLFSCNWVDGGIRTSKFQTVITWVMKNVTMGTCAAYVI